MPGWFSGTSTIYVLIALEAFAQIVKDGKGLLGFPGSGNNWDKSYYKKKGDKKSHPNHITQSMSGSLTDLNKPC